MVAVVGNGNSCSIIVKGWFHHVGDEFPYLVTDSQNAGNSTDELISFVKCNFIENAKYRIVSSLQNDLELFIYDSADEILFGGDNIIPALGGINSKGLAVDTVNFVNAKTFL